MAAAAILDFENFKFLTVVAVKRVELHHRAKFRQNRSNRGRNMTIFRFFKMAAAAILDFRNFEFLTVGTVKRVELLYLAKFRQNRSKRSRNICGKAPTEAMYIKICVEGDVLHVITCAKFQNKIFRGCNFTGGRIFHFFY